MGPHQGGGTTQIRLAVVSTRLEGSQIHRFGGSQEAPRLIPAHMMAWAGAGTGSPQWSIYCPAYSNHAIRLSFRAVIRNRNTGRPVVFGIRLDQFDHQIQFVGGLSIFESIKPGFLWSASAWRWRLRSH